MCWQWPDRGVVAEPDPGRALGELDGDVAKRPGDVAAADVELPDDVDVAGVEPPDVAAKAIPAPAASPATVIAPPTASRRSTPADLPWDMSVLLVLALRRIATRPPLQPQSPPNLAGGCRPALKPLSTPSRSQLRGC